MSAKCQLLHSDLGAKVSKQKDTPHHGLLLPCFAKQAGRLRNSGFALRQSSPKTPYLLALLGVLQGVLNQLRAIVIPVKTGIHFELIFLHVKIFFDTFCYIVMHQNPANSSYSFVSKML